ncbi:DUF4097 family beta strand repeat-containing protein [Halobacterium wangiae]|uniref:DUF4097 family beta strand repeat-containing protein n=1 Tax=Halobacterium wangiae TaxID=2902623 RepID=UPI001E547DDC|nr:DUF4097 family beta strand repeat-containing protein [Halobacterium wangiae]
MDHASGPDHTTQALETTTGDCVSVRTPEGDVNVEPGESARLHTTSESGFSVTTWREDATLNVAVERDGDDAVDVELELPGDCRVGSVSTGSGDVVVRDVDGAPAVETAGGDVRISGTTGVQSVWTGDGDAAVSVATLPRDATVETVDGDVTLALSPTLDATVELHVRDGDVNRPTDVFDDVEEQSTEYVRGVLGDGDRWLTAKTGSGDATVQRT